MEDYFKPYEKLAQELGYDFGCSALTESPWLRWDGNPLLNKKYCFLKNKDIFFWAFDNYGIKLGMNQIYSGIYRWVRLPEKEFQCRMEKRFFLDFLSGGKRDKTGIAEIDGKVTLHTNDIQLARRLITPEVVEDFLNLPEKIGPVQLIIGNEYIPEFKDHRGEQSVGLEVHRWYTVEEVREWMGRITNFLRSLPV